MTKIVSFTLRELVELRRALDLISVEDTDCNVNMGADAVSAKQSALKKLNKALGWKDRLEKCPSVLVSDLRDGRSQA